MKWPLKSGNTDLLRFVSLNNWCAQENSYASIGMYPE